MLDLIPLTDEEIAELERQDHAPDRRLLATIRQRTQERDEQRDALFEASRQRDGLIGHYERLWRIAELERDEAVALLGDYAADVLSGRQVAWLERRERFIRALADSQPGSRDREEPHG
jgi:hypothetical protein